MGVYSLTRSGINNWVKYSSMMAGSEYLDPSSDFLITETVLGASQTSVTFDVSSLAAQGYKHLQIRIVGRSSSSGNLQMRINGDTGANYSWHRLYGDSGYAVGSNNSLSTSFMNFSSLATSANTFTPVIIDLLDFGQTTKNKTAKAMVGRIEAAGSVMAFYSGAWYSTAAITSLTFSDYNSGSSFVANSRFSIYASKG